MFKIIKISQGTIKGETMHLKIENTPFEICLMLLDEDFSMTMPSCYDVGKDIKICLLHYLKFIQNNKAYIVTKKPVEVYYCGELITTLTL